MPLTKAEADAHFVNVLYPKLPKIIAGRAYKSKRFINIDAAITEAYLHLDKNRGSIETTTDLEKLVVNFLVQNIQWSNSQLNKQEKVNVSSSKQDTSPEHQEQYLAESYFIEGAEELTDEESRGKKEEPDDQQDLEHKIELELWYNDRKALLALYRQSERDPIKQIIFDCYFKKGLTVGTALAKHLGIGRDTGARYIKALKTAIIAFAEAQKQ